MLDYHLPELRVEEPVMIDKLVHKIAFGKIEHKNFSCTRYEKGLYAGVEQIQGRCLARDIHLYIRGAEHICIIGKNGCGKTTLLRKIAEELLHRTDIKASYMPQNYEELLDMAQTPVEFLSTAGDKDEISRIRTYLGSMKYTVDEMSHSIGDLSGGQKAKILLLKMSMAGSNVLILDEPTRNFSPMSNPVIRQMLKTFQGAIISVSHDRKYIEEVADKVYELTATGLKIKEGVEL